MDYIFFDFNGTLVDDLDVCINLLNNMLVSKNHDIVTKKKYLDIFTFPVIEYYKKAGFEFPKDNFDELASYFIEEYKLKSRNLKLFDDVESTLLKLKIQGKKLIILSASELTMLKWQLKHYGIIDYFDEILGSNNIYARGKSEIGLKYMEENNIDKSKCVFIGDTLHDEEVADKMGINCILVKRGHQSENVLKKGHSTIMPNLKDINF